MRTSTLLLTLALLAPGVTPAADPPDAINYQGVLRDADGNPEDGSFDMRFRFFDAENAGNELIVDEHLAAGTGAVGVSGGLFSVPLGSGTVLDGAGPGTFSTLAEVFGQTSDVYLEIEVGGETLTPRVRVLATAYALNAAQLSGRRADDFLDTSATPQVKNGLLTALGGIDFGGGTDDDLTAADVDALTSGGNADALHTHDLVGQAGDSELLDSLDSSQFLRSDADDTYTSGTLTIASGTVLNVQGTPQLNGQLFMDADGPDGTQTISFYDGGSPVGESFGWNESLDRFTISNTLRVENQTQLEITGNQILLNVDGPDATQAIYFYNGSEPAGESLQWDDTNNRFFFSDGARFTDTLDTAGNLIVGGSQIALGEDGPDQDQVIAFYDSGSPTGEFLVWDDSDDDFRFSDDLTVDGFLTVSGPNLFLGGFGIETTQPIYFFEDGSPTGESFLWDDGDDRFELTDELAITGVIRTGSTVSTGTYNSIGTGVPDSTDISTVSDLFVTADLEVGSQLYLNSNEYLSYNSVDDHIFSSTAVRVGTTVGDNVEVGGRRVYLDIGGQGLNEYLEFLGGQFFFSDDLDVFGTLTANSKNFVQNHPADPNLEIVYTTLEGPEAATFTRGSGRLEDGVARIALDDSFAWVTNPDLGLTATLTPRGEWADLYVESVSPTELVVASAQGEGAPDTAFDYLVMGLRIGLEESPVVRPKKREAFLPDTTALQAQLAGRPDLVRYTPLARHRAISRDVYAREVTDLSATEALKAAVGTSAEVAERILAPADEPLVPAPAVPSPRDEDEGDEEESPAGGHVEPATDQTPHAVGVAYEDGEGNLYARSFRPDAGGLGAVSPVTGEVAAGDVLTLDPSGTVRRSEKAEDPTVVGIATGAPEQAREGAAVPFAVAGIVLCRVDAAYGPVLPGDMLVTSPNPGHAMRADVPRSGTVLGKALEPLDAGTGLVRVLVAMR